MLAKPQFRLVALFALGYFASYVFRGVNIGFAPLLTAQFGLSAADLGTLTSAYFLGFAVAQVPAGVLLDHYGARRVVAALLLVAAAGALLFALADGLRAMMIGRLLIGVGVSACLGGAFKALAQHFPYERLPMLNGVVMAVGGLGGVAVGTPLAWVLTLASWRQVCVGLAVMTTLVAVAIYTGAPEARQTRHQAGILDQFKGTWQVSTSRSFWKTALFPAVSQGVFYAMQSLWVGAFLRDVGMGSAPSATHAAAMISVVGAAFMLANLVFGGLARILARHGVTLHAFCGAGMLLFILVQVSIIVRAPLPPALLWAAYGAFGCTGILAYAVLVTLFPSALIGRVNTTFTLLLFVLIFVFQIAIGAMLGHWPMTDGHYPVAAHVFVWWLLIALQVASGLLYCWPTRKRLEDVSRGSAPARHERR